MSALGTCDRCMKKDLVSLGADALTLLGGLFARLCGECRHEWSVVAQPFGLAVDEAKDEVAALEHAYGFGATSGGALEQIRAARKALRVARERAFRFSTEWLETGPTGPRPFAIKDGKP